MKKIFITSTGTDIGKSYTLSILINYLKNSDITFSALKPIISGWVDDDDSLDTIKILESLDLQVTKDNINAVSPWRFAQPLSPDMAARAEQKNIDFAELIAFSTQDRAIDYLLIEGAGGVLVPLNNQYLIADWIKAVDASAILVVGSYLGSISHTLSAIEALLSRNIVIDSIVLNQSENSVDIRSLIETLRNFTNIPIVTLLRNDNAIKNSDISKILGGL